MTVGGKEIEIVKMILSRLSSKQREEVAYFLNGPKEPDMTESHLEAYQKMIESQKKEIAKL